MLLAQTHPQSHRRHHISIDFLEDLLKRADDIQEAALIGKLDYDGQEHLNLLGDIQRTLAEAMAELEYRLGRPY